ncbi:MAG: hypothetical protein JNM13_10550 [Hyphomicrobiaceae bacterium]|nr:hypothetical protein [Hyphomicrobiaceae bacterium]
MRRWISTGIGAALPAIGLAAALAVFVGAAGSPARADDGCPMSPARDKIMRDATGLAAAEAIARLELLLRADRIKTCEAIAIDRAVARAEASLIGLRTASGVLPAQAVFHCGRFDPAVGSCDGLVGDGTAQPLSAGLSPLPVPGDKVVLDVRLSDASLIGLFRTSPADLLDGKPAAVLGTAAREIEARAGTIVFAVFETKGAWRYRKAVWYF